MKHVIALLLLICPAVAQDRGKIFVVRHAEKASTARDAQLSEAGKLRAECLALTLRDSTVGAIIVSEFRRTQETALPLATRRNVTLKVVSANETEQIARQAKQAAGASNVLVVAHSNTIPAILTALGAPKIGVADEEFDRLFVVSSRPAADLVSLRYCPAPIPTK